MKKFLSIISVGYILYGIAMFAFVGFRILEILKVSSSDPSFSIVGAQGIPILSFVIIGLVLSSLACWLGYILFKLRKRKTVIVLACLLLLGFPFGTVLGIITLCLLLFKEIKNAFSS